MDKIHHIEVGRVPSQCGDNGHTDLTVNCSCGFTARLNHGESKDVSRTILYHRLTIIEKILEIELVVHYQAGML